MTSSLGRLTVVDVRKIWAHEANDFTPWLARPENMKELADALSLGELEVEATERDVGRFSADIVAREDGENYVLIENQLEATDHRHLGQVLTYLAGLEGDATIVWLATKFLEEHRAAIDWLNANTNERFNFFGVEIEIVRIGDSQPAPRFNVVAKPNDWSRNVGSTTRAALANTDSEAARFYSRYWLAFSDFYDQSSESERLRQPSHRHYFKVRSGVSRSSIDLLAFRDTGRIQVKLLIAIRRNQAKEVYRLLEQQRADIEAEVGAPLVWDEKEGKQRSQITITLSGVDLSNEGDWPRQFAWFLEMLRKFRKAFKPRLKAIAATVKGTLPDDEDNESDESQE